MLILDDIIRDRGSKYAVSGGPCTSEEEAKSFIKALCRKKKFAKATHNSWALLTADALIKSDDGEAGAGMVRISEIRDRDFTKSRTVITEIPGQLGGS